MVTHMIPRNTKGEGSFFNIFSTKALIATILLGLITYSSNSPLFWGGSHGYYVNHFLITTSGMLGAILVNVLIIALVIFIFLNDIYNLYIISLYLCKRYITAILKLFCQKVSLWFNFVVFSPKLTHRNISFLRPSVNPLLA